MGVITMHPLGVLSEVNPFRARRARRKDRAPAPSNPPRHPPHSYVGGIGSADAGNGRLMRTGQPTGHAAVIADANNVERSWMSASVQASEWPSTMRRLSTSTLCILSSERLPNPLC